MKAIQKKHHLERDEEENRDDVLQEQPSKKQRKNRFLACLKNAWSKMTGCKGRKTSSQEERSLSDLPGPSNIYLMDTTDNRAAIESYVKQVILQACQQVSVEQVIQEECQEMCDRIHSMEDLYAQYYRGQNGEIQNGEEDQQEPEKEGPEKTETDKKRTKNTFLSRLRKTWAWIAGLKRRRRHVTSEGSFCETPGPSMISMVHSSSLKLKAPKELSGSTVTSQSSRCHEEKSMESGTSLEEPGSSEETSSGTVPLSLESFTFHRTLGEGSFGRVFSATDNMRKECVAIKVSDKRDFTEGGYSLVERQVLQISHENPYLIHGLAAFHTPNFIYYVMEAATRGDLDDFIWNYGPFDAAAVKPIAAEMVCGIEFLHRNGILHRDLKPQNLLLTREGHLKITDFGLAITGVFKKTKDECQGTLGYAAPEMVKGQAYGRGVDFFAIGVIIFKLFAKMHPFPGVNPQHMKHLVLSHTPICPDSLTPDTVDLIEKLLCKDQFQRLGVNGDIRKHPFFTDVCWEDVEAGRMAPPPAILMAELVDLNLDETMDYAEPPNKIKAKHQKIFHQFSFVCPEWSKQYHPVIIQPKNWMTKFFIKSSSTK